jgi:hypothetical protein
MHEMKQSGNRLLFSMQTWKKISKNDKKTLT